MSQKNSNANTTPMPCQPCEAAQALPSNVPSLDPEAKARARDFILEFGTNLQRERFLYHFAGGERANSNQHVLAALSQYQNEDGGFGHGIEADLRSKQSTVIATTIGLQILSNVDGLNSVIAERARQYLSDNATADGWRAIHAGANDAPHAPWWRYDGEQTGFCPNPSVEVLTYLLEDEKYKHSVAHLLARAIDYLQQSPLEMHELLCFVKLYGCQTLTKAERIKMLPHLLCNGFRLVNGERKNWEEYCLTPLSVVTHPGSIFAEFFADVLPENFSYLIDSQNTDGSWNPAWSWAGEFPGTWKVVETEIKAEITLKNLLQFRAFEA